MPYITTSEYEKLISTDVPVNFEELERKASDEIDVITRFYFAHNVLDDSFKANQFRKAVAYQVEFYKNMGYSTVEQINSRPDSIKIGDTTVGYNRTVSGGRGTKAERASSLSKDAIKMLSGTGLLYRGAHYV